MVMTLESVLGHQMAVLKYFWRKDTTIDVRHVYNQHETSNIPYLSKYLLFMNIYIGMCIILFYIYIKWYNKDLGSFFMDFCDKTCGRTLEFRLFACFTMNLCCCFVVHSLCGL